MEIQAPETRNRTIQENSGDLRRVPLLEYLKNEEADIYVGNRSFSI